MTKLRLATPADVPLMVELGAQMHAESSFAPMTFSREKVAASLLHGIQTAFVAVSLDDRGEISGAIHGDVIEPWYSTDRMGVELFLYVRPQCRGSRAALMLLRAWIAWCAGSGAKQIRPATAATSEAADKLYRALSFTPVGALYVMNQKEFP
jgi:GNAT superfamily N-acetyltransferase